MTRYNSLILNDHYYNEDELWAFCTNSLQSDQLDDWEKSLYEFILQWLGQSDSIVLHTSGTTSSAKCIFIKKADMVQSAVFTGKFFSLKAENTALLCLPTRYIAGQMMVVRAFVLQLNLITLKPGDISLSHLTGKQIDFAAMLPMQLQKLIDIAGDRFASLKQIKSLLLGGASLSDTLIKQIVLIPCNVYQSFGMTETISHIAIRKISPGYQPYYTLLDGFSLSQDNRGCLVVSSQALNIYQLVTNDVVKLHSHNQFTFLGRLDNVINSGGIKINPEFIEGIIESYITARRFFVAGVPDEKLGQKLMLFIEGPSFSNEEMSRVKQLISTSLERYSRPKKIIFVKKFIETESGKIKRKESLQRE
jgi:o-succinylbenzoate---CoA ligase